MAQVEPAGGAPADEGSTATVRLNLFISGLYAWLATVAWPAFAASDLGAKLTALGAVGLLIGGLLLAPSFPRLGRGVTMAGFLGLSVLTWVLLGSALEVAQLEPVRAASGALGWMLFAFSWGSVRNVSSVPENDPRVIKSEPLLPRRSLPLSTSVIFGVSIVGGLIPWLLAWRVVGPERALFAHAAGLLCAIAVVVAAAHVAVRRGKPRLATRPNQRLSAASNALAGLVIVAALGIVVWLVRR